MIVKVKEVAFRLLARSPLARASLVRESRCNAAEFRIGGMDSRP
jgi:hypothetical protein